jgi:FtsZ-binding cell division protein ZapB
MASPEILKRLRRQLALAGETIERGREQRELLRENAERLTEEIAAAESTRDEIQRQLEDLRGAGNAGNDEPPIESESSDSSEESLPGWGVPDEVSSERRKAKVERRK